MRAIGLKFLVGSLAFSLTSPLYSDYIKGASYFAQGKYDLAVKEYQAELRSDPAYVQGYYLVGICYAKLKQFDRAIESLKKAQSLDGKDFQIALALAEAYFEGQHYSELRDAVQSASLNARTPADLDKIRILRGAALFNQQKYAEALEELKSAIQSDPKNATLQAQAGIAEFRLQRFDEAIAALGTATTLNPDDAQAALYLGESFFARAVQERTPREKTKDLNEAARLAQKWAEKQPQRFEILSLAGRAELGLKNYSRAITYLERAVAVDPNSATSQFNLGQAYAFVGRMAEAESALTRASQTLTQEPTLFSILGFVYEKQDKLEDAEGAYEKAYQLAPSRDLESSIDRVKQKRNNPRREKAAPPTP